MTADIEKLNSKIQSAVADGRLMQSAAKNIRTLLAGAPSDLYSRAVSELVEAGEWPELNDRFYQTLAFGTGGLRGRTIGKVVTKAERGDRAHSAVATNATASTLANVFMSYPVLRKSSCSLSFLTFVVPPGVWFARTARSINSGRKITTS